MTETIKKNIPEPKAYGPQNSEIVNVFQNLTQISFEEKKNMLPKYDGTPPTGSKIENIHRLWYEDKGENFMFAGCVRGVLETLGEANTVDYTTAMALTGDMFTQMYNRDREADCLTDNCFLPEIALNLFRNCGYESAFVTPEEIRAHGVEVHEMIKHSILRGVPVIAVGVNHIPVRVEDGDKVWNGTCPVEDKQVEVPFGSLIGGYEGDKLLINVWIGEALTDENGYATARNALETTKGLVFVGNKTMECDIAQVYRNILKSIPSYLTLAPNNGYSFGKQAFYDWAKNLQNGEILKVPDCWNMQFAPSVILFTNDGRVSEFMQRVRQYFPEDAGIVHLAELYEKQRQYIRELNDLQGGFEFDAQRFREPEFTAAHTALLRSLGDLQDEILAACYEINE